MSAERNRQIYEYIFGRQCGKSEMQNAYLKYAYQVGPRTNYNYACPLIWYDEWDNPYGHLTDRVLAINDIRQRIADDMGVALAPLQDQSLYHMWHWHSFPDVDFKTIEANVLSRIDEYVRLIDISNPFRPSSEFSIARYFERAYQSTFEISKERRYFNGFGGRSRGGSNSPDGRAALKRSERVYSNGGNGYPSYPRRGR